MRCIQSLKKSVPYRASKSDYVWWGESMTVLQKIDGHPANRHSQSHYALNRSVKHLSGAHSNCSMVPSSANAPTPQNQLRRCGWKKPTVIKRSRESTAACSPYLVRYRVNPAPGIKEISSSNTAIRIILNIIEATVA